MEDFVKSGILGVVVGDCLGVPFEFRSEKEMQTKPCVEMTGYGTWNKPVGTWSDDTSMTLATIKGIVQSGGSVDYDNIMREFCRWYFGGDFTVDGDVFDCGGTTRSAILNYVRGKNALDCGLGNEENNGNGSLMRILPLAFTDADYETIMNVSALTHSTDRCKIACVLYVEIARQLMEHYGDEYTFCDCVGVASEKVLDYFDGNKELVHFNRIFESDYSTGVRSSGYVINTLECAIASIKYNEDFESALLWSINLGGDTDTVGAVTGGLASLYYGLDSIPVDWLDCVVGLDFVDGLIGDFVSSL